MDLSQLLIQFHNYFGKTKYLPKVFFAPGRVNLIGEHTDYNGGKVFPMAIDAGTYLVISENSSGKINFASANYEFKTGVQIDNLNKIKDGVWVNYPLGIVNEFVKNGIEIKGFDAFYSGNIPPAAGLSSSASIEMVTAFALNEIYRADYDRLKLVKLCKKSENEFIGVNCGIMDMFAVGFGKENNAIALDCATLEFDYAPLELNNLQLVVSNTNKERGLADSKYNERVSECNQAVQIVRRSKLINNLSELSLKDFRKIDHLFPNPVIKRRAYHVVSENYRVEESLKALKNNDFNLFGKLMNASHVSLRDNYEVTGSELDCLVDAAIEVEGVIGSRMTGAGFGGCTISLVDKDYLEDFYEKVTKEYKLKTGRTPLFYLFKPSEGVRELSIH